MAIFSLNNGLLRQFYADELSNNTAPFDNSNTPVVGAAITTTELQLASIVLPINGIDDLIWLNGTVCWEGTVTTAPVIVDFRIYRSIDNGTNTLIFSIEDSLTVTGSQVATSFSHVDAPPVTACNNFVVYSLYAILTTPTARGSAQVDGPITFIAADIQFVDGNVALTNNPDILIL